MNVTDSHFASYCSKANTQETVVGWKRKVCFFQVVNNLGTHVQKTNSPDTVPLWIFFFFKGKAELISVNHWGKRSGSLSFSIVCRFADSLWSFLGCYLVRAVCLQDYWGESWGKDLVIYWLLTLYSYFFNLMKQYVGQVLWSKDLKGVLGLEVSGTWGRLV